MNMRSMRDHFKKTHNSKRWFWVGARRCAEKPFWVDYKTPKPSNYDPWDPFDAKFADRRDAIIGVIVNMFARGVSVHPDYMHYGQLAVDHYVQKNGCEPHLIRAPRNMDLDLLWHARLGKKVGVIDTTIQHNETYDGVDEYFRRCKSVQETAPKNTKWHLIVP